ncbi:MAG: 4a-hydroxytetrahydrobiopterin dehydratase [Gammaproteobacteria bacterium]|nr:MAG: 4a-hydroxytetrahydrobiopterin dehydratase [Gammaproteobacteria bacterium]
METQPLHARHCHRPQKGTPPLAPEEARRLREQLHPDWRIEGDTLVRTCRFGNYYETIAFVNALAWIAHREDHHPDLQVGYNRVEIRYTTHALGGLSENDFICAARIDRLLEADD